MKKQKNKQAKISSKRAITENKLKHQAEHIITVKNAEGDPDTKAKILVQNNISYTPKVSVIIPVYNVEDYLRECLDSVVNQTLKEIEIICVDDGSTDNSLEILKEYAAKDSRITIVSRENKGVGYSRNEGIRIARGEFVAFMDPDDYYPDLSVLEMMYKEAVSHQVKICGGSLIVYDEHRKIEIKKKEKNEAFTENSMRLYQDFQYDYGFQRYIYKRDFIQKNNIYFPNYRRFQDPPFMVKAFAEAEKFYTLELYVYAYRWAHKTVNWTEEKVYHLFCGLRDNLLMSKKYNLETLFSATLVRIKREYKQVLSSYDTERIQNIKKEIMSICLQSAHDKYARKQRKAKVSVILPIYNAEPYLRECLDSVVNQTLKDIEIICVNDGSTDNSLDIIKEYAQKDIRIRYIDKPNAGYGQTMNCGMDLATGEYIGIVEPDDFIKLEMYETLYNKAKEFDLDIVKSDYITFSDTEKKYVSIMPKNAYNKILSMEKDREILGFTLNPTGIFKNLFLKKYKILFNETPGAAHQDIGFWALTTFCSQRIYFLPYSFYMYRQNNINSSMNSYANSNIMFNEYAFVGKHLETYPEIWNCIKDIYFKRRHISLMYFGTNRIAPQDKLSFFNKFKKLYQSDLEKNDFLKYLGTNEKIEAELILKQDLESNVIPVIYATNKNYVQATQVSIKSIKFFANPKFVYRIYVIHTQLNAYEEQSFTEISEKNISVSCLNISNNKHLTQAFSYTCAHYSKEMYYRILIPKLFPQYKKVLYVDSDTLFIKDIAELYCEDIGNCVIGAVVNPIRVMREYICNTLLIDPEKYFNSGILIINTFEWERFNTTEKCIEFLSKHNKNLKCPDQDTLNVVCQKKIAFLNMRWNWQWIWHMEKINLPAYCSRVYYDSMLNLSVIHYATGKKPWNTKGINPLVKIWRLFLIYKGNKISIQKYLNIGLYPYLLNCYYHYNHNKLLHIHNPRTFNEKIQWLKLYDSTPIKTRLADKYLVREWVKEKIGEQYLIPLLGVYDKFEDIDFDKLPNQFVIKCNHGSGWNIIVKDKLKLDLQETKEKLDKWLSENFAFKYGYELHYRDIQPKIIIEQYVTNDNQNLYDYKFWCFNGEVKYMQFRDDFSTNLKMVFYDLNWNKQSFYYDHPLYEQELKKPDNFDEMVKIARKCCQNFAFVCVDLYRLNDGTIKFGEMTFTRSSGCAHWNDDKYNLILGNMIKLPKLAYNIDTGEYYKLPKKSKLKPYIFFPYNLCWKVSQKYKERKLNKKLVQSQLAGSRIDIKNIGNENNAVEIATSAKVYEPAWFASAQGQGKVVESNKKIQNMAIKAIQNGKLVLSFKGQDKRFEGTRFPLWIDYKSIKINGKEILSVPVEVWHDKPFRYEMPVKDGQVVTVEVAQQYYQYTKDELKDIILKLNPNSDYVKSKINKLTDKIYRKITVQDASCRIFPCKIQKKLKQLWDKFSFASKIAPLTDLMRQNQAETQKLLQEIKTKNQALENKNNELKKEIDVLKNNFNTQLAEVKKQQEEHSRQLISIGDKLFAGLRQAVGELQDAGDSQGAEMKSFCSEISHQLADTEVQLVSELNHQRDVALQNKNNITADINQAGQALQAQAAEFQDFVQQQFAKLDAVQEKLTSLSSLKEIDFAQKEEVQALAKELNEQKSQLLDKVQSLQNKTELQYQELNFADLLHDCTQNSPWLKDKNFALYSWAANYSFIYTLFRILDNVKPDKILEMGMGQTTLVTSQYIANYQPQSELDIIENDVNWINVYQSQLAKHDNIHLHQCDIEFIEYEGEKSRKYKELNKMTKEKKYNLIIVDGPFGGAQKLPRSNIIELVEHNLAQDFIIIFDDAERLGEQNTIAQTKAKLTELGIGFDTQQRNALKSQFLIFSKSCEFAKYL